MKALEMLYRDKKWIEEECDISKITIERVQTMIKDLVEINEAIAELKALQQRSCLSCTSCNKDTQLMSCPPQYTLSCGVFNTVFVNDFKQSCSRYEAKEQL